MSVDPIAFAEARKRYERGEATLEDELTLSIAAVEVTDASQRFHREFPEWLRKDIRDRGGR